MNNRLLSIIIMVISFIGIPIVFFILIQPVDGWLVSLIFAYMVFNPIAGSVVLSMFYEKYSDYYIILAITIVLMLIMILILKKVPVGWGIMPTVIAETIMALVCDRNCEKGKHTKFYAGLLVIEFILVYLVYWIGI